MWRRWPDAVLDPMIRLSEARSVLTTVAKRMLDVWSPDSLRGTAAAVKWNKGAVLATEDGLASLDALIQEARAGSLAAMQGLAGALNIDALQAKANKVGKQNRATADGIADWPIAVAATALAAAIQQLVLAVRADCLQDVDDRVRTLKRERSLMGFDDLLGQLHAVLAAQGSEGLLARAIRQQFQAALIDEFQDTDSHQFHVFRIAFAGQPLFLIGDPKQAIYAFRGADVRAYLEAARQASHRYSLEFNFRSTPPMVQAVNALFSRSTAPFVEPEIAFHPATARNFDPNPKGVAGSHGLHWLFVPPDTRNGNSVPTPIGQARTLLFRACASRIASYIKQEVPPGRIAVLVRKGFEGVEMVQVLAEAGVRSVVSGLGDVMQSLEMAELQRVLEAIAVPRDPSRVRAALATTLWGATHEDLVRLASPEEREWEEILTEVASCASCGPRRAPCNCSNGCSSRVRSCRAI